MSVNSNCVVLGDLNLDHLKWALPEGSQEKMVNEVNNKIETSGFQQLVKGATRTWKDQNDSCLDHIWANCPNRVIKTFNTTRGSSDHNVIGVELSLKEIKNAGNNIVKRMWKEFYKEKCLLDFKNSNWQDILMETNVNVAAALLEERICSIMDVHAPFKTIQIRAHYKDWISTDTKKIMFLRDTARTIAKRTDSEVHWTEFKRLRNSCTSLQKQDKKNPYKWNFQKY